MLIQGICMMVRVVAFGYVAVSHRHPAWHVAAVC